MRFRVAKKRLKELAGDRCHHVSYTETEFGRYWSTITRKYESIGKQKKFGLYVEGVGLVVSKKSWEEAFEKLVERREELLKDKESKLPYQKIEIDSVDVNFPCGEKG